MIPLLYLFMIPLLYLPEGKVSVIEKVYDTKFLMEGANRFEFTIAQDLVDKMEKDVDILAKIPGATITSAVE